MKIKVSRDFLFSCLGDDVGFLEKAVLEPDLENFRFEYDNWEGSTDLHPDICAWSAKPRLCCTCEDIGRGETLNEAKQRVKEWFYREVIPLYLQSLFC